MTRLNLFSKIQTLLLAVCTNFAVLLFKAQGKGADLNVDVNMNKGTDIAGDNWMSSPLIWVVGALVLIIIIALVARGNGKK